MWIWLRPTTTSVLSPLASDPAGSKWKRRNATKKWIRWNFAPRWCRKHVCIGSIVRIAKFRAVSVSVFLLLLEVWQYEDLSSPVQSFDFMAVGQVIRNTSICNHSFHGVGLVNPLPISNPRYNRRWFKCLRCRCLENNKLYLFIHQSESFHL